MTVMIWFYAFLKTTFMCLGVWWVERQEEANIWKGRSST